MICLLWELELTLYPVFIGCFFGFVTLALTGILSNYEDSKWIGLHFVGICSENVGNFFGWWRISRSPVLPCVCRPTDKFGRNKRPVLRLLTSLVAVEESVLVASKIRWASKRVERLLIFGSGESEEICLVSKSAAWQNSAVLFLCRKF